MNNDNFTGLEDIEMESVEMMKYGDMRLLVERKIQELNDLREFADFERASLGILEAESDEIVKLKSNIESERLKRIELEQQLIDARNVTSTLIVSMRLMY